MARRSLIRTIYSTTRSLGVVIKDAQRARQIATVLARHGFGALASMRQEPGGIRGALGLGPGAIAVRSLEAARAEVLSGETATEETGADVAGRLVSLLE